MKQCIPGLNSRDTARVQRAQSGKGEPFRRVNGDPCAYQGVRLAELETEQRRQDARQAHAELMRSLKPRRKRHHA